MNYCNNGAGFLSIISMSLPRKTTNDVEKLICVNVTVVTDNDDG